jgi:hypothetical protein
MCLRGKWAGINFDVHIPYGSPSLMVKRFPPIFMNRSGEGAAAIKLSGARFPGGLFFSAPFRNRLYS